MRVKGWEKRLKSVVEKHLQLPSKFGISDCYIIADDAVEAVTGEQMYKNVRNYTSEIGAAKLLRKHGFENVEQAFAAKFDQIPASLAQRGDIGIVYANGELCGGFFSSLGFVARDPNKLIFVPFNRVQTAFKVGR